MWRSEPVYNRGINKNINMLETVSIITYEPSTHPRENILKGYISGEYTYDFRLGPGSPVESIAGLLVPLGTGTELSLDWRHRDRIHSDDCDTFEAGVAYNF